MDEATCLWCGYGGSLLESGAVTPVNPQVTLPHRLLTCPRCQQAMVDIPLGSERLRRKAHAYPRRFRKPLWVVIYPVACAWCGAGDTEAYDINATIANPLSTRFKYDVYRCGACERPTAISYLGEIRAHQASQDQDYPSLWYLDPEESA